MTLCPHIGSGAFSRDPRAMRVRPEEPALDQFAAAANHRKQPCGRSQDGGCFTVPKIVPPRAYQPPLLTFPRLTGWTQKVCRAPATSEGNSREYGCALAPSTNGTSGAANGVQNPASHC